jgi:hypothetical protein
MVATRCSTGTVKIIEWVSPADHLFRDLQISSKTAVGTRKAVSIIEGAVMRELRHSLYANGGFD